MTEHAKRALVIGASGGVGGALSTALGQRGYDVMGLSRSRDGFDLTQPETVEAALEAVEPGVDLMLVASGVLTGGAARPEKALREVSGAEMAAQFAVNAIGPALVLRHAKRLLPRGRRGVFAALSARVGSIGDNRAGGWYAYRASKAALNQIVHTGAIELARSHKHAVCVCLHPGTVETRFTENYSGHDKVSPAVAAANLLGVIDGLGPQDTGGFYDWAGKRVPW
ncbi:SDR family NAD(P)-dependent oxidoreductase [Rhodobacteraceae bacterium D3-12]|nr:SDR family NAD(P)-dependent oxidoreductase [Rhodobacteraceae bacterium D3-12]